MIATDLPRVLVRSPLATWLSIPLALCLAIGFRIIYRIWLHPLSAFPGPRQAAISNAWLHKLSQYGRQEEEFEQLHQAYENHYHGFGIKDALFSQTDFALHKKRRQQLNPFFARAGIFKLEPTIREHTFKLRAKFKTLVREGKSIVANKAFRCVAVDIVSQFAFARSRELVDNSDDAFTADYLEALDGGSKGLWDSIYSPFTRRIGEILPTAITSKISKSPGRTFALADHAAQSIRTYKASASKHDNPVIFDSLLDLSEEQLVGEALDLLVAGSDTAALTLTYGVLHIANHPVVKSKLVTALDNARCDTKAEFPTLIELESIPYLVACVKESLRIAMSIPRRLPRVVPVGASDPLVVDGKIIPPRTTIGMSAYTMHFSEQLWGSDARTFNPDRWMGEASKGLDANLVAFSKGARNCVGQNPALAEVLIIFAMLFRSFTVELDPEMGDGLVATDTFTKLIAKPGLLLKMTVR